MEFPVSIHIGANTIPLHAILEPIAFFTGFRYFLFLKKRKGDIIPGENRVWIIIAAIFGSLIGSRLVGGLENPEQLRKANNLLLYFYSNKTVLGGLLGGLAGVECAKRMIGERNASGDLFVAPIILALIIGRAGCFSMGVFEETYGLTTSWPTGMDLGDGLARHPAALYEIAFLVLLWIALRLTAGRFALANGALFKLFMIAYLFFRFFLDFIKPSYLFSIGLSTIQVASVLGLLWYIRYIIHPRMLLQPGELTVKKTYA
jgi:phosphatidylglycerol---prolipoprotein diacylglyceryl transferase